MPEGTLYIIPIPISEKTIKKSIPPLNVQTISTLRYFIVERTKTARRYLRTVDRDFPIDDSQFFEMDKHNDYALNPEVIDLFKEGKEVGLMSEAGYPAIADPGYKLVARVQEIGVKVVPLVGPSSLFLALAASGLNGESFTFNRYIPQKEPERSRELKQALSELQKTGKTQLFIETPYRNQKFFEDVIRLAYPDMKLCIAIEITGEKEWIQTKTVEQWKKKSPKFEKNPAVFLIGL